MSLLRSRPRRNRVSEGVRRLVRETSISPNDFVLPLFVQEGDQATPIGSMPGHSRLGISQLVDTAGGAFELGVPAVALFPALDDSLKDARANESTNADGLLPRAIRALAQALPDLVIITDVAFDPYSSDGHDGYVSEDGRIDNDESLPTLAAMAVTQAAAGAHVVAPSDMMDGRVGAIRGALDEAGHADTLICSYCTKYASAYYGPFREALDSAPRAGDKKTYQMDPGNARELLREVRLDEEEGADWLMVKPGLPYADVLCRVREATALPVAAYHVSGEYAMLKAAAEKGWTDYDRTLLESLLCLKRAGADIIFTYGAVEAARLLKAS